MEWLYQAKKRYRGLSVLNYMVTSNHVHLLIFDNSGRNIIPDSIKLVAGRTGQEYNTRKNRNGAFWQDRYHATAVESNRHLRQDIAYIDMNMVRAGVVDHPGKWECSGYNEIQNPQTRKSIFDFERLMELLGFKTYEQLQQAHFQWVDSGLQAENKGRQAKRTQSVAVGGESFIEKIKEALGFKARGRKIRHDGDAFELREALKPYGPTSALASGNTFFWDQ